MSALAQAVVDLKVRKDPSDAVTRRRHIFARVAWDALLCSYSGETAARAANCSYSSELQEEALVEADMIDMHLEVDVIPVSDVERSKQFYERLGWRHDADDAPAKDVRIVQFTPPGSGCSVTFGKGITPAAPGSAAAALVVSDIEAAHKELTGRGVGATEVWHGAAFPPEARIKGPDPSARATDRSSLSTIPTAIRGLSRRSRRGPPAEPDTAVASTADLASASIWVRPLIHLGRSATARQRPAKRAP
jgi:predicted enzyme related to lactoylglutathione lyase